MIRYGSLLPRANITTFADTDCQKADNRDVEKIAEFIDDQYERGGTPHTRLIARGIVLDEEGNVAVHLIHRNDIFGNQRYYETPGGGVDEGESIEEGFKRECLEELGYEVEIIGEIGIIEDEYRLIGRKNVNCYFLARRKKDVGIHFASEGDLLIEKTIYVPIDEAIKLYESQEDKGVSLLVKRRELPILMAAKTILEENASLTRK